MPQHDYDIANQTAPNFRSDLNNVLDAIATNNSGLTEPSVTYANQWWYDSDNDILKIRSEADDAWINVGYLDQSTNEFKPYVGSAQVDTQSTSTWETGTSTTEGIVSPAKVKAAISQLAPSPPLSEEFQSTGQTITSGGSLTLAHGLSAAPKLVQAYIKCTTADLGYSVGDEVILPNGAVPTDAAGGNDKGIALIPDATNIVVQFSDAIVILESGVSTVSEIDMNDWDFYVRAFK